MNSFLFECISFQRVESQLILSVDTIGNVQCTHCQICKHSQMLANCGKIATNFEQNAQQKE